MKTEMIKRAIARCVAVAIASILISGCGHGSANDNKSLGAATQAGAPEADKDLAATRAAWMKSHPGQEHP